MRLRQPSTRGRDATGRLRRRCRQRRRRLPTAWVGAGLYIGKLEGRREWVEESCSRAQERSALMPVTKTPGCARRTAGGGCPYINLNRLNVPGARRFPGGRFAEINPASALARHDIRRPAGGRGRAPALLDRTIHK